MSQLTPDRALEVLAAQGSIRKAAPLLGVPRSSLQDKLAEWASGDANFRARLEAVKREGQQQARAERPSTTVKGDEATVVSSVAPNLGDLDGLVRDRGLDPEEWEVVHATLNEWEAPVAEGGTRTMRQMKAQLRRRVKLALVTPARHVPTLARPPRVRRAADEPRVFVVEGDHQAPYHDPELDAAATAMVADLQPERHVFLGDLCDFPTISRHADHPAAMATAQECIDEGYGILRRRAEAAPNAERFLLKGNHDWRLESELLARAERMYGIRPAGEAVPALSLHRLLHLDAVGVELVEDPRGWEHAEVELVPGPKGLVVRHGWVTGANTAGRSMAKRGRSLIVGHSHAREHVFAWDPSAETERQAVVLGTMSRARDPRFPHFATLDGWLQGPATVTLWPSGRFLIEHALWQDGALYWRDRAWRP